MSQVVGAVCKESNAQQPGASGFCYRASEFCSKLHDGQVKCFEEFKLQKKCEINSAHQNVFGAS